MPLITVGSAYIEFGYDEEKSNKQVSFYKGIFL